MKLFDNSLKTNWKLLVILICLVSGVIVFVTTAGEISFPVLERVPSMPAPQTIEFSDWQTYRNDEFGFEVKYPEGWVFEDNGAPLFLSENDVISHANPNPHFHTFSMGIEVRATNDKLEAYLKKRFNLKSLHEFKITPEESGYYIDWLKTMTLGDNIQAYFIHERAQAFSVCHFFVQHNNIVIEVTRDGRYSCLDDPQFDQILSTFRFIAPQQRSPTSQAGGAIKDIIITEKDNGKNFVIDKASRASLRLSTQFLWSAPKVSDQSIKLTSVDYLQNPGFSEWIITPLRSGNSIISSSGSPNCSTPNNCSGEGMEFRVTITVR